jgi:hypothetical protein
VCNNNIARSFQEKNVDLEISAEFLISMSNLQFFIENNASRRHVERILKSPTHFDPIKIDNNLNLNVKLIKMKYEIMRVE